MNNFVLDGLVMTVTPLFVTFSVIDGGLRMTVPRIAACFL